jgi:hypothetical protein
MLATAREYRAIAIQSDASIHAYSEAKGERMTAEQVRREAEQTAGWHAKTANRYHPDFPALPEMQKRRRVAKREASNPEARRLLAGFRMIRNRY